MNKNINLDGREASSEIENNLNVKKVLSHRRIFRYSIR